jgi:MoxR-like ATPase
VAEAQSRAAQAAEKIKKIGDAIETVIVGKRDVVDLTLAAVLCGGHVLVEDIPGVGKTTLAKALAKSLGCLFKRVQFTPDLLPSDITGTTIFNQKAHEFEFREGPVFAHVVLADEINRATPKTQSALLECMEEYQVTADGITYQLPQPFVVIATENHVESYGTFPLPVAQLDRFLMRIAIGYPSAAEEAQILDRQSKAHPLEALTPATGRDEIKELQEIVRDVFIEPSLRGYIVSLVAATREHPRVSLGVSPRGSLSLLHAAQAYATMQGRTFILPDDVKRLAAPVLSHRMLLTTEARGIGLTTDAVVDEITAKAPVPTKS